MNIGSMMQIQEIPMKLFGQVVRTAVNVITLPVAIIKDISTLGGIATEQPEPYTVQKLKQLKDEAR
jgi:hypothetical protein